ncbi:hypothetical protein HYFRA_00003159 [Hymenoscyphus fraxineus]|uniref:EKC/KEOPS complex subunit BUD32 n=1 Tax=Hymenoscyphus fraxineus TaxID=746836 RepID=A0A9N9KPV6_9HELO|nr:hypothetical protein HYFRA_00003159 [Hymenoscyphus fraxineus]
MSDTSADTIAKDAGQKPDGILRGPLIDIDETADNDTATKDTSHKLQREMEHATEHEGGEEEQGFVRLYYPLPVDNVEDIEMYRPRGFHPTHINDILNGYKIIHKIGCGGYSTVWLAQDLEQHKYVVIKIITADASSEEKKDHGILEHVFEKGRGNPALNFIDKPIKTFHIDGPNGKHLCIISSLLGPSIAKLTSGGTPLDANEVRHYASQLTHCVDFLHSEEIGIVHGDLTTSNVLLEISSIDQWSIEQVYEILGEPSIVDLHDVSGEPNTSPSGPKYIVEPINIMELFVLRTRNIKLIDFGESFRVATPPEDGVGTPVQFCSPELFFHHTASKASDIWALGCTIFEMRIGMALVESGFGYDWEFLNQMTELFGPVPGSVHDVEDGQQGNSGEGWTLWHRVMQEEPSGDGGREDDNGERARLLPAHDNSSRDRRGAGYFARLKSWIWGFFSKWWTTAVEWIHHARRTTEERQDHQRQVAERRELKALYDLLSGTFKYDITERSTAFQMLFHPWLSVDGEL